MTVQFKLCEPTISNPANLHCLFARHLKPFSEVESKTAEVQRGNFENDPSELEPTQEYVDLDPIEEMSTGEEANREETLTSAKLAFILIVLSFCILLVHYLIAKKLHHVPESVSVVFFGAVIGLVGKLLNQFGHTAYVQDRVR